MSAASRKRGAAGEAASRPKVLPLQGPNLNLLGTREPATYGRDTLAENHTRLEKPDEIHLTNVHAREAFRHHSYFSDKAVGTIVGLGPRGYEHALDHALALLRG
jgi:3-dehydroquinate dehydratase